MTSGSLENVYGVGALLMKRSSNLRNASRSDAIAAEAGNPRLSGGKSSVMDCEGPCLTAGMHLSVLHSRLSLMWKNSLVKIAVRVKTCGEAGSK